MPDAMRCLGSAASWLKPPAPTRHSRRPRCPTSWSWHNHRGQLAFLGGYVSLNLLLFTLAALRHVGGSGWVAAARGCGQCLNFNCAFIAVSAALGRGEGGDAAGRPCSPPNRPCPAGADAAAVSDPAASHPRGQSAAAGALRGPTPAGGERGAGAGRAARRSARGQLR